MITKANHLLTPGVFDQSATASDIAVAGYAKNRRPSLWQGLKLKGQALVRYGLWLTPTSWHRYTLDHLVPLELAGMPLDIANVWPQRKSEAKLKDVDENRLKREVVAGAISLRDAQQQMLAKWRD